MTGCDYEDGLKEFERLCGLPGKNQIHEVVPDVSGFLLPQGALAGDIYPLLLGGAYDFVEVLVGPQTPREILQRWLLVDSPGLYRYELSPRENEKCRPFIEYREKDARQRLPVGLNADHCVAALKIDRPDALYEIRKVQTDIVYGTSMFWGSAKVSTHSTFYIRRETGEIIASSTWYWLEAYRFTGTGNRNCSDKAPAIQTQAILRPKAVAQPARRD